MLLLFTGALLFLLRGPLFPNSYVLQPPPGGVVLWVFALYAAALAARASVQHEAWIEVFTIISYGVAYWVWSSLASHHKRWRWLLGAMMLSVTIMAWYALIQHGHDSNMVLSVPRPEQYEMRASGAYICPNHFASLLAIFLPMCLSLVLCRSAGGPLRLFAGYTILLALPPLFLSQSRSGWLGAMAGLAACIVLLAWRTNTRRFLLAVVATPVAIAVAGLAAWMLSPMVQSRVAAALRGDVRLNLWRDTWTMIQDSFLTGFGPGSYGFVYPHYRSHLVMYTDPKFAHNEYLHLLADYGLIGLILCSIFFVAAAFGFLRFLRGSEREKDAHMVAGLSGAVAAALVHGIFDYNLHTFSISHALIAFAGITASGLFASGDLKARTVDGWRRGVIWITSASVLLVVMAVLTRMFIAYLITLSANKDKDLLRILAAESKYTRAAAIDPLAWEPRLALADLARLQGFWNIDKELRAKRNEDALRLYGEVLALNPWNADALFGTYKTHMNMRQKEKGLELLFRLVDTIPHHAYYLVELGLRLREIGRDDEALVYFEKSLQAQPSEMARVQIADIKAKKAKAAP